MELSQTHLGHRFYHDCLRESWARWVEWAIKVIPNEDIWFVTMTFKREVNAKRAITLSKKWLGRLWQAYDFEDKGLRIRWIRTMALQVRGVYHFHLLICAKDLDLLSRKRWEHRWQCMDWNSGTCRVYRADYHIPPYLVRELTKEGDLSWGGLWRGLNTPGAIRCCEVSSSAATLPPHT
jgi:hypothetical protein